mgnify:FL=1
MSPTIFIVLTAAMIYLFPLVAIAGALVTLFRLVSFVRDIHGGVHRSDRS